MRRSTPRAPWVLGMLLAFSLAGSSRGASREKPPTMKRLLARHIGYAWLKKLALDDLIAGQPWNVDLEREVVRFGTGPEHRIQLLGTESKASNDFLWAWANTESQLPPGAIRGSEQLRSVGARDGIQELTTRKLPLTELDGEQVGSIASGLLKGGAFYLGDYGAGVAVLLLVDFPRREQVDTTAKRIVRAVGEIISAHALDHRLMLEGLAQDIGARLEPERDARVLVNGGGERIRFRFDPQGRIAGMEGRLSR